MLRSFRELHNDAIVIDTHNDILSKAIVYGYKFDQDLSSKTHSDLFRFKKGGIDVQFFAIWCDGEKENPFEFALKQIAILEDIENNNPGKLHICKNYKDLLKSVKDRKLAALIGIEGGHMIEDNLNNLSDFYKRGARYMTLTWNNSTSWATSAADEKKNSGLSEFGKKVILKMNEIGMMIDISHVNERTFWDAVEFSSKPILATHSNAYSLCPHPRNLKDEQIRAIAKMGGVVQVNFYSAFLDATYMGRKDLFIKKHKNEFNLLVKNGMSEYNAEDQIFINHSDEANELRSPFSLLIDHIEYIIQLVGIDYVGLGADYDGMPSPPILLDDVSTYPLITRSLLENGYSESDVSKVLGGNLLRVLKANEIG